MELSISGSVKCDQLSDEDLQYILNGIMNVLDNLNIDWQSSGNICVDYTDDQGRLNSVSSSGLSIKFK